MPELAVLADDEDRARVETVLDLDAVGRSERALAEIGEGCANGRSRLIVQTSTPEPSLAASWLKRRVSVSQVGVSSDGAQPDGLERCVHGGEVGGALAGPGAFALGSHDSILLAR